MANLLTDTEEGELWTTVGASVTTNATTGPAAVGGSTADLLTENSAASTQHYTLKQTVGTVSGTVTASCYIKANGRTQVYLILQNTAATSSSYALFDLTTPASSGTGNTGTGFTVASQAVVDAGNSWRRVSITTAVASAQAVQVAIQLVSAGNNTYTGNGTSGVYFNGAMLNTGAVAGPYERVSTSNRTGAAAVSLGGPSLAASGTVSVSTSIGAAAVSVAGPAVTATGAVALVDITGTGAVSLGGPSLAAAGSQSLSGSVGSAAVSLGGPTVAAAGTVTLAGIAGSAAVSVGGPAVAAAGSQSLAGVSGGAAVVLGGPAVAAAGSSAARITGTGAIVLGGPAVLGAGGSVRLNVLRGQVYAGRTSALRGQVYVSRTSALRGAAYVGRTSNLRIT